MKPATLEVQVVSKAIEAVDICSFELVDPLGKALPRFSAGSHVDVHIGSGLSRQYSLCNDPREQHRYLIAVLRDPVSRGGSAAMHDRINKDDLIQISEPKNHFALAHDPGHSILLAGGIGITPIICMVERLANIDSSFELHYCTRTKERTAFKERIEQASFADRSRFHFDDQDLSQRVDIPRLLSSPKPNTHLYVCGPPGFLNFAISTSKSQGWANDCVHYEYFSAPADTSEGDVEFDVKIASSGQVFRIPPSKSVTAALLERGVEIPVSCEQGVCGTCLTRVLEGSPDHRDNFLTAEERARNDQFTPCCSRSLGSLLVLDL